MFETIAGIGTQAMDVIRGFASGLWDILAFLSKWPKTTLAAVGIWIWWRYNRNADRKYWTSRFRHLEEVGKISNRLGFGTILVLLCFLFIIGSYAQWQKNQSAPRPSKTMAQEKEPEAKELAEQEWQRRQGDNR